MTLTYIAISEKDGMLRAESVTAEKFRVSTVLYWTGSPEITLQEWRALARAVAPQHDAVIVSDVREVRYQRVSIDRDWHVVADPDGDHVRMFGVFLAVRTGQPLPPKFWVDDLPVADLRPREM